MSRQLLVILLVIVFVRCGTSRPKEVFRIAHDEMILTIDSKWTKAKTDSILVQYDMVQLPVDSAFRYGNTGKLANEGWKVRRKNEHEIEVYKSTASIEKWNMSGIPVCIDNSNMNSSDSSRFVEQNGYSDAAFGFNEFKEMTVTETSDGITQFTYDGGKNASEVLLSGSFNQWSTSGVKMTRTENGWIAKLKLIPGKYEYKFIVDGSWIRDTDNLHKTDDFSGDFNSVYYKTNYTFVLNGYSKAKKIILAGSFNDWNEEEIKMQQVGDKWIADVFLPIGTHEYKFIVDGNWIIDPANSDSRSDGKGNINSFLSFGEPTLFRLNGFLDATDVRLAGSFNEWNPESIRMIKKANGWEIPYVVRPGVYEYKFVIDGKWTFDPTLPHLPNPTDGDQNFIVIGSNHEFHFVGNDETKSVYVTGSFCDWREPGYPLIQNGNDWTLPFHLTNGKHTYKYIVNGVWTIDKLNPLYEENEYSTGNSVLWIK